MKMTFRIALTCLIASSTIATAFADDGAAQVSGSLQESPSGSVSISDAVTPVSSAGSASPIEQFKVDPVGHVSLGAIDAQGYFEFDSAAGQAVTAPFGPWISLDQRYGEGIGYRENYYNVRSFLPKHLDPGRSMFFAMLNGAVTDEGQGVVNAGFGFGLYSEELNRVFRASG